jgi:predicted CopG family antitoxin
MGNDRARTNIAISNQTHDDLRELKRPGGDTFDRVIRELIERHGQESDE